MKERLLTPAPTARNAFISTVLVLLLVRTRSGGPPTMPCGPPFPSLCVNLFRVCVYVRVCAAGGAVGDGHPVGSGQQAAGEIQDAGGHR